MGKIIILCAIDLYSSYVENDLRKVILFKENEGTNDVKAKGTYTGSTLLFSGLATDEVYLIRAECNARMNNVKEAMKDLNTLLKKRWKVGTFMDLSAIDGKDALEQVLVERKKELLLRGLRWSDLRRLNKDEYFKTTLTRNIGGKKYTIEPDSYKYTLPFPDDIIQITGMEQNPGWNK